MRILVVGAGPAGLKAAEIAARNGHAVQVHEATSARGGNLRHTRGTAASSLFKSITWLEQELAAMEVEVHLNSRVDLTRVRELQPDALIIGTGTLPGRTLRSFDPGTVRVLSSAEALENPPSGRVLVLDRTGQVEAGLVAERLSDNAEVQFVTPYELLLPYTGYTHRLDLAAEFRRRGIQVRLGYDVAAPAGANVELRRRFSTESVTVAADVIVAVIAGTPDTTLVDELSDTTTPYRVVGDALACRDATIAFREGEIAALGLPEWAGAGSGS
jgi:hypothetical protein